MRVGKANSLGFLLLTSIIQGEETNFLAKASSISVIVEHKDGAFIHFGHKEGIVTSETMTEIFDQLDNIDPNML